MTDTIRELAEGLDAINYTAKRAMAIQVETVAMLVRKGVLTDVEVATILQGTEALLPRCDPEPKAGQEGSPTPEQR